MIGKRTVRKPISFVLVFLLGLYGCGAGNAKVHLSTEEVAQLKSASHVYIVDYPSPEIGWWIHHHDSIPFSKIVKYNLQKAEKWLNISFSLKLNDPTTSLKHALINTLKEKYHFTNIVLLPNDSSFDDNLMDLKQKLGQGKVIDIKTNFWHLYPAASRRSLNPEERSYQFQYSGYVRFIDLDTVSVIHQRSCHYPPQTNHMGQWLQPKEYPSLSMNIPTWENSMNVPDLIEQQGEKIQIQIHKAVTHCLQEFQNLFPYPPVVQMYSPDKQGRRISVLQE